MFLGMQSIFTGGFVFWGEIWKKKGMDFYLRRGIGGGYLHTVWKKRKKEQEQGVQQSENRRKKKLATTL